MTLDLNKFRGDAAQEAEYGFRSFAWQNQRVRVEKAKRTGLPLIGGYGAASLTNSRPLGDERLYHQVDECAAVRAHLTNRDAALAASLHTIWTHGTASDE